MTTIAIAGFGHVGIRVHDLARSLAFYEQLGFVKTLGPMGPEPVVILEHPSGIELNLVLNAPNATEPNILMDVPDKHPGYTHIALLVDDLDAAQASLATLAGDRDALEAAARGIALTLARGFAAALLARHAAWTRTQLDDARAGAALRLFTGHGLSRLQTPAMDAAILLADNGGP